MSFPLSIWGIERNISFGPECTGNILGNPTIAMDGNQNIIFAVAAIGTNGTASPTLPPGYSLAYNIAVGCVDANGNLLWYKFFPQLVVITNQTSPTIVIGKNNDIYLAFVTPGSIPGYSNQSGIPIFCPCANSGPYDIVLARINYTNTDATLAWWKQDAEFNSCSSETVPKLAIDTTTGLLYVTLQTSGNVLCYTPVGAPNVFLACFTLAGLLLWTEERSTINGAGTNTNPVIVADLSGGVYLAYETNSTVQGGRTITSQQIEVVKFQTTLLSPPTANTYYRPWILSSTNNIFATGGTCSSPTITTDNKYIYLAFLTTGSVAGNTHTPSLHDLVVCTITFAGSVVWVRQGTQFNTSPYVYYDAAAPYITTNQPNNAPSSIQPSIVYVSLQTYSATPTTGNQNTFIYGLTSTGGQNTFSIQGFNNFPVAYTGAQSASFPTAGAGAYSQLVFTVTSGIFYLLLATQVPLSGQVITSSLYDLALIKFILYNYYPTISPFQFMSAVKTICNCGANCSCSTNVNITPDPPFDLSAVPGFGSATISFFPGAPGNTVIVNYSYSTNGTTFTPLSPSVSSSHVTITGLAHGTRYTIYLKAIGLSGLTSIPSIPVTVTPT